MPLSRTSCYRSLIVRFPLITRVIPLPDLCATVASGSPRADFLFQRCGFVRFLVAGKVFVDLAP